jgi:hypothetical protein
MWKWILTALLCFGLAQAVAQTGPLVSIAPTDLLGSTLQCNLAAAINTQNTCTINVGSNQHAYINYLLVGVCGDSTTNTVNTAQGVFTSTNLNGWQQQFSFLQGATIGTPGVFTSCQYIGGLRTHPLMSVAGPATVTIVSPAGQAHSSYPINVEYYLAQ